MDGLIDQSASTFDYQASFDGPTIVLSGAPPFHVSIGLENLTHPALRNRFLQKLSGIVEAVLADWRIFAPPPTLGLTVQPRAVAVVG